MAAHSIHLRKMIIEGEDFPFIEQQPGYPSLAPYGQQPSYAPYASPAPYGHQSGFASSASYGQQPSPASNTPYGFFGPAPIVVVAEVPKVISPNDPIVYTVYKPRNW